MIVKVDGEASAIQTTRTSCQLLTRLTVVSIGITALAVWMEVPLAIRGIFACMPVGLIGVRLFSPRRWLGAGYAFGFFAMGAALLLLAFLSFVFLWDPFNPSVAFVMGLVFTFFAAMGAWPGRRQLLAVRVARVWRQRYGSEAAETMLLGPPVSLALKQARRHAIRESITPRGARAAFLLFLAALTTVVMIGVTLILLWDVLRTGRAQVARMLIVIAIAVTVVIARRVARHFSPRMEVLRRHDPRNPTLLFRRFAADSTPLGRDTNLLPRRTLEEVVARETWGLGPLIAIGNPSEKLPPLGASRTYVDNQDWKAVVLALLGEAIFVVLIPARARALRWEHLNAMRVAGLDRLVYLFPPTDPVVPRYLQPFWDSAVAGESLDSSKRGEVKPLLLQPGLGSARLFVGSDATPAEYTAALRMGVLGMKGLYGPKDHYSV